MSTFILIDQVRFECMRRLGWVYEIPLGYKPIIGLIREYKQGSLPALTDPPKLTPNHPNYPEYALLNEMEKQTFIRRTIPEAVKQFQAKVRSAENQIMVFPAEQFWRSLKESVIKVNLKILLPVMPFRNNLVSCRGSRKRIERFKKILYYSPDNTSRGRLPMAHKTICLNYKSFLIISFLSVSFGPGNRFNFEFSM